MLGPGVNTNPNATAAKADNEANSGITYLQIGVMPGRAAYLTMLPNSILSLAPVTWCLSISLFPFGRQPFRLSRPFRRCNCS